VISEEREPGAAGKGDGQPDQQETQPPELLAPVLNEINAALRELVSEERAAQSKEPSQTDKSDLEAQQAMAVWAQAMFWATLATVFVAIVGVIYVRRTLLESRRIGQSEVRAYLYCSGGHYIAGRSRLDVRIAIENMGGSPSPSCIIKIRVLAVTIKGDTYVGPPVIPTEYKTATPIPVHKVAEGSYLTFRSGDISDAMLARYHSGIAELVAECLLEWTDVFGDSQTASFALVGSMNDSRWNDDSPRNRTGPMNAFSRVPLGKVKTDQ